MYEKVGICKLYLQQIPKTRRKNKTDKRNKQHDMNRNTGPINRLLDKERRKENKREKRPM